MTASSLLIRSGRFEQGCTKDNIQAGSVSKERVQVQGNGLMDVQDSDRFYGINNAERGSILFENLLSTRDEVTPLVMRVTLGIVFSHGAQKVQGCSAQRPEQYP